MSMLRGCRLLRSQYQPVCVAPLYIMPRVCAGACLISHSPPCVVSVDECGAVVEQTFTVRVPLEVGADAALGQTRLFCVNKGEERNGYSLFNNACLLDER